MIYRDFYGFGRELSVLCLGTGFYDGITISDSDAFRQLEYYLENGGNFIDTAHLYGFPDSRAERILGAFFRESGFRDKVFLCSKGAHPPLENMSRSRVNRSDIFSDMEKSLEYLDTDCIDLYFLHRDDEKIPAGEITEWMNELIRKGMTRAWGVSNWKTDRIRQASEYAAGRGLTGPSCNQAMWSYASVNRSRLRDQTLVPMDRSMFEYHRNTKMPLMAYTSQARGYFPLRLMGRSVSEDFKGVYDSAENDVKYERICSVSRETGISVSALSMLFFLLQPFGAFPIVTYANPKHFEETLDGLREENLDAASQILTEYGFL